LLDKIQSISLDVKNYYEKNWQAIANCYQMDNQGLPIDSAWYRRRIYKSLLESYRPSLILDIGCGGGHTVLDALELGLVSRGIEPILDLVRFGQQNLEHAGYDKGQISLGDASSISNFGNEEFDLVAMLSVIPHVPESDWDSLHEEVSRVLKPGGISVIAYRNELFDMFTANRFSHTFFMKNFFSHPSYTDSFRLDLESELKKFIPFFNVPEINHTESPDKSFGELSRPKTNPLTYSSYIEKFGLQHEKNLFCNFHATLPNMGRLNSEEIRSIKHELELDLFDKWQGNFMSSMFVAVSRKSL
jgi:ubiquinone/menaquinone biosynthesis C-methylase UbiE